MMTAWRSSTHRTWEPLERRLAQTSNERHRAVLSVVIEHMKAEAAPDLERLMATLSPDPAYHFWHGAQDVGAKTTDGVRSYYVDFLATRTNILEFEVQRLVVDDDCLVTEVCSSSSTGGRADAHPRDAGRRRRRGLPGGVPAAAAVANRQERQDHW